MTLVGGAAGYVTKCSGEGIYFAAKSGRMAAEAVVERSQNGTLAVDESDLRVYLDKWDRKYWATYKVLDILQKVFYRSNPAREAFVEMCADEYVQKMTFDSYLYKTVVPGNPIDDIKLLGNTVASIVRANALRAASSPRCPCKALGDAHIFERTYGVEVWGDEPRGGTRCTSPRGWWASGDADRSHL